MTIQDLHRAETLSLYSREKRYNFFLYILVFSILFPPIIRNIIVCHRLICFQAVSRDSVCGRHSVPFSSIFFFKIRIGSFQSFLPIRFRRPAEIFSRHLTAQR